MALNKVFLWDVRTGKLLDALDTGGRATFGVTGLAAFPDGKRVIACVTTGLTVWDFESKSSTTLPLDEYLPPLPDENPTIGRWCFAVAFTAEGSQFATTALGGTYAARILLWNAKNCQVTGVIPVHRLGFPFAYSADGRFVAAEDSEAGMTGPPPVGVWDTTSHKKLLSGPIFGSTSRLALTPHGNYLLAAGKHKPIGRGTDNMVIGVWDVRTGELVNRVSTSLTEAAYFALSPDNKLMAVSAGRDIEIYAIEYTVQSKPQH
jgi:DNA-binding beta-propeller fold protein YncE